MIKVIGVRFRKAGKVYFFDPVGLEIKTGDCVIVETARGIEYGRVVIGSKEVEDDKVIQPLKSVIRVATEEDHAIERRNKEKEKEAFASIQTLKDMLIIVFTTPIFPPPTSHTHTNQGSARFILTSIRM